MNNKGGAVGDRKHWTVKLLCGFFGWHTVKSLIHATTDGFNLIANCDRCGVRVFQDSEGNWFEAFYQPNRGLHE